MEPKRTSIWIHSDLQLNLPERAEAILSQSVDDLVQLGIQPDEVWCLGDAVCGGQESTLCEVAQINLHHLRRLGAPVFYVMGNHEMDLKRLDNRNRFLLREQAASDPLWHMAPLESPYLLRKHGETLIVLMGDHAAEDGSWWTSHGLVHGEHGRYPHLPETYRELRRIIDTHAGQVIIASHYAFPGGQRPSRLMGHLLPLPPNVALHLHGHAHIGDLVHNKEYPWRRENPIDGETIHQYNISALESVRSPGSHSALLEFGACGPITLRIRCHAKRQWLEEFSVPQERPLPVS